MQKLYLFNIASNFHLLLALSYIRYKRIDAEDTLFITYRGVRLPGVIRDRLLFDSSSTTFMGRWKFFLMEKDRIKKQINGKNIVSFSPYQFFHPLKRYFHEYSFIEEGFSAYTNKKHVSTAKGILKELFKIVFINLRFPFQSKNVKGFLLGIDYSYKVSRNYEIIVCSDDAFCRCVQDKYMRKCVIPIASDFKTEYRIMNSIIIVMDRITPAGRPFDKDNYFSVLKKILITIDHINTPLYVKMHPSDYGSKKSKDELRCLFQSVGINAMFIDGNLEIIALSDNNNTFIGTNSTILYYAPIFGKSNSSISFARLLAQKDTSYTSFLDGWGGVDVFCELFSKQVKCL